MCMCIETIQATFFSYQIAAIPTTLSELQGHSPIASHFKWEFLYSCAAVDTISTGTVSCNPSETACLA